ncbi:hypothetical protein EVAR_73004_1 [Eumeta japonica]|uniref:Uncharacterized protein n=1 Tax=Eumeta variegata TaxID=151549 RepID=A0A4C1TJJ2_EUMVA|nr:hypothetical protein EVAR_73004_1 [Eumeta japonica]
MTPPPPLNHLVLLRNICYLHSHFSNHRGYNCKCSKCNSSNNNNNSSNNSNNLHSIEPSPFSAALATVTPASV